MKDLQIMKFKSSGPVIITEEQMKKIRDKAIIDYKLEQKDKWETWLMRITIAAAASATFAVTLWSVLS